MALCGAAGPGDGAAVGCLAEALLSSSGRWQDVLMLGCSSPSVGSN